jgi:hypothetical protein
MPATRLERSHCFEATAGHSASDPTSRGTFFSPDFLSEQAHEKRQFAPALIACNYMDFADGQDGRIEAAFQVFSQGLFREMTTVVAYHLFALL